MKAIQQLLRESNFPYDALILKIISPNLFDADLIIKRLHLGGVNSFLTRVTGYDIFYPKRIWRCCLIKSKL